jgi:hypothetical protein
MALSGAPNREGRADVVECRLSAFSARAFPPKWPRLASFPSRPPAKTFRRPSTHTLTGADFCAARFMPASNSPAPAPHFEITLTASVNGTSTGCTRSFAMM